MFASSCLNLTPPGNQSGMNLRIIIAITKMVTVQRLPINNPSIRIGNKDLTIYVSSINYCESSAGLVRGNQSSLVRKKLHYILTFCTLKLDAILNQANADSLRIFIPFSKEISRQSRSERYQFQSRWKTRP